MKLGPNSLNAAASRWPGRGQTGLRRRANKWPNRRKGAAVGTASNGNSASCRARVRQIRTRRARLRTLRKGPNEGRNGSETPGGVERSDAPGQVAELDLVEPGAGDHFGELALPREAPNAFDEIGVGIAITGDDLTKQRHDLEAVEVVKRLEEGGDLGGEFEAEKMPARLQDAARLGERRVDPGDVSQPEADRVEIDAAVGYGEPLGVGAQPLDTVEYPLVESASASDREHRLADIADDGASVRGDLLRN